MAVVRNSVGSNCYVSDEIITSRAGVRIRVGNTDAEVCTFLLKVKPNFPVYYDMSAVPKIQNRSLITLI